MVVRIVPNETATPPGKLADAELLFEEGVLNGSEAARLRDLGAAGGGNGRNVTFPARQYSVNGERRSFSLLRPVSDDQRAGGAARAHPAGVRGVRGAGGALAVTRSRATPCATSVWRKHELRRDACRRRDSARDRPDRTDGQASGFAARGLAANPAGRPPRRRAKRSRKRAPPTSRAGCRGESPWRGRYSRAVSSSSGGSQLPSQDRAIEVVVHAAAVLHRRRTRCAPGVVRPTLR